MLRNIRDFVEDLTSILLAIILIIFICGFVPVFCYEIYKDIQAKNQNEKIIDTCKSAISK